MLRLFVGLVLVVTTSACTTFSSSFLVQRNSNINAREAPEPSPEPVLYRPGTAFHGGDLQLLLPWINVCGCGRNGIELQWMQDEKQVKWSVGSKPFHGAVAFLEKDAVTSLLASDNPSEIILKSKPMDTTCLPSLSDDVPSAIRVAVGQSHEQIMWLLKTLVAERLPSRAGHAWKDQYGYDETTRSLNLFPGMRLRVAHEAPVTTDAGLDVNDAHIGSLTAPVYLYLQSGGATDIARGTWTPTLSQLKFNKALSLPEHDSVGHWSSVTGLNELTGLPRYWRIYAPKSLRKPELKTYDMDGAYERINLVGKVSQFKKAGQAWELRIILPQDKHQYYQVNNPIVINGVNLRIASVNDVEVRIKTNVAKIERSSLSQLGPGSKVNVTISQRLSSGTASGVMNIREKFSQAFGDYPGFVLVAADNPERLARFNHNVGSTKNLLLPAECQQLHEDKAGRCYILRFRGILVPEIPITVQGEQVWVEVGTTVRDILYTRAGRRLRDYAPQFYPSAPVQPLPSKQELVQGLQDQVLLDALHGACLTRQFGRTRAPILASASGDESSVPDITIQIGDEIQWLPCDEH